MAMAGFVRCVWQQADFVRCVWQWLVLCAVYGYIWLVLYAVYGNGWFCTLCMAVAGFVRRVW